MNVKGILELKIKNESIDIHFYKGNTKFKKQNNDSIDIPRGMIVNGYIKDANFLVDKVREFIIKNNIKTNELNIMLETCNSIIQKIQIPMVPDKDIRSTIDWQLKKYHSNNYDQYIMKYSIIDKIKNSHKRMYIVYTVLMERKNIERYYQIAILLNMNIQSICIYSRNKDNEDNILNIDFSHEFVEKSIKNKIMLYVVITILAFGIPQLAIHFLKTKENILEEEINKNKYVVQNINEDIDINKKNQDYNDLCKYVSNKKKGVYSHIKEIKGLHQQNLIIDTISINDDIIKIDGNGIDYNSICTFIKECEVKFKNACLKNLKFSGEDKNYYFTIVIKK